MFNFVDKEIDVIFWVQNFASIGQISWNSQNIYEISFMELVELTWFLLWKQYMWRELS